MTIGLTHNTDLYRVQIALTSLGSGVSTVHVERSLNELLWQTVRGGTALPVVAGAASLDDYEYAASGDGSLTTYYRVTMVDPPPGLQLDGDGDYASTPDHASLDITGDIDLRVDCTVADWTDAAPDDVRASLCAKWVNATDNESFALTLENNGTLQLFWTEDGSANQSETSSVAVPFSTGRGAVRATLDVDNGSGGYEVTFYTADTIAGPWTQLGAVQVGGSTTSIFSGAAELSVGGHDGGTGRLFAGTIHAAEVYDGIDGTAVANPAFVDESSGTGSFADAAGRTWTLQGDAEIVVFATETDDIIVTQSAFVAKSIRYPLLNRAVKLGDYSDLERPAQLGVHGVTGRSFPIATTDVNSSVRFQMEFVTETEDEARRLKLLLALGDILYLQSPAEVNTRRPPRSMYVVADSSAVGRIGSGTYRRHAVPFTEVAAPAPKVTGATLTWAHVFAQFGNWDQLITANPTWFDLLSTVGDPDDLVVL